MPVEYVKVEPRVQMFRPATRSFGDIVIVGAVDGTATGPVNRAIPITNPESVSDASRAAETVASGSPVNGRPVDDPSWFLGDLALSVRKAFGQAPGPSLVWAIRLDTGPNALVDALAVAAKLDVQIVVLANTPVDKAGTNKAQIEALAAHVNTAKDRIGIAMFTEGETDPTTVTTGMANARMVMVAHHSKQDAAAAVAGAIAGYEPHVSMLLKPVSLGMENTFTDSQIEAFDKARINWLVDPSLFPGKGLYLGEGYTLAGNETYIDVVRTIDDISFRLKAALIGSIGDLRISRPGLRSLESRITAILEPLKQREVIDSYQIFLPLLVLLDKDPGRLTDPEMQQIDNAQNSRAVDAIVTVDYAGAIHRLSITFTFK